MSTLSNAAAAPRVPVLADAFASSRVRTAVLILGGALFMALCAQISFAVPPYTVPFTAQTLGVMLIGASLGFKRGTAAMVLYVIMGLFLPVFSDGHNGLHYLLHGGTGGYILGFVVATAAVGWLAERGVDRKFLTGFVAFVAAQVIIFTLGVIGLKLTFADTWGATIHNGFTIFIIWGLVKAAVGAVLMPAAWKFQNSHRG
ncbi:MAG: biotin transporter BioY [Actinomycetota bacterium]|nr:biotin transporter BioY [Actinomycetota bacterium]